MLIIFYVNLFLDSSLNDIKYVLNPTFTPAQIDMMDSNTKMSRAIDGTMYMPGIVGLNNIKANDYCNVILQVQVYTVNFTCTCRIFNDIIFKIKISIKFSVFVSCKTIKKLFFKRRKLLKNQKTAG